VRSLTPIIESEAILGALETERNKLLDKTRADNATSNLYVSELRLSKHHLIFGSFVFTVK
jgi:hypothetical protein